MLFKDDFYTIEASIQDEESINYSITLNKDHAIFAGHFPGNPVTPGVAQMEIVKELIQISLEKKVKMESMPTCKFLAILNPEENANVDVQLKFTAIEDSESKRVSVVIKNDETSFLKMIGVYC